MTAMTAMTAALRRPLDRPAAGRRPNLHDEVGRGQFAIWLPWLAAPVFLLLPVAGCGAAAALRHRVLAAGGDEPVAVRGLPVAPVATVAPVVPGTPAPPRR